MRILYYSRSGTGETVASSGVVLFPEGNAPAGGWPVIAWAHELNDVARPCAPSLAQNLVHGPFLAMYVKLGYAIVATDYAGLGTNFRNAFADVRANAFNVIDSIPAARQAVPGLGARWIAMGTAEGGAAAIGVAELGREMRDPNFLGSIAISRIMDAEGILTPRPDQSHELPLLLAYGIKTIDTQFEPKDMLTDEALPLYEQVGQSCGIADAAKIPIAAMLKLHWDSNRFVEDYFKRNRLGTSPAAVPILVISSEGELSLFTTTEVVRRLCKQGDRVLFNRYAEYNPGSVIGDSVRDQMAWIQDRFAGRAARSNCTTRPYGACWRVCGLIS